MCLSGEMLDRVDEFFDLIANEEENQDLDFAMDSLRHFLEKDIDGWTSHSDEDMATAIQERLEEIWSLISAQEKKDNYLLEDHYLDMVEDLETISTYDESEIEEEEACNQESEDYDEDPDDDCEEESWD